MNVTKAFDPEYDSDNQHIIFKIQIEGAKSVFLAGSWNNWAGNNNGTCFNPKFGFQLEGDNTWVRRELLVPGKYSFKYAIDGSSWYTLDSFPHDENGNTVMYVNVNSVEKEEVANIAVPHWSSNDVPFSNGFSASKFNLISKTVDCFTNHIYQQSNPDTQTVNIINFIDFKVDQSDSLLSYRTIDLSSLGYDKRGGIVTVTFTDKNKEDNINAYFFSSFNEEQGSLDVLISRASGHTFSAVVNWNNSLNPHNINNTSYNTSVGTIYVTEESDDNFYRFSLNIDKQGTRTGTPTQILSQEQEFWKNWLSKTGFPVNEKMSGKEKALYLQSLSVLKMAQCRESGNSHGQILASLPPGHWNICWIRDASYAIGGLALSGHLEEAKAGLEFFLKANVGKYQNFISEDINYGVGAEYQISVCRYYGDGTEWSDGDNDPNIELDGFGLFLMALELYMSKSGDLPFILQHWPVITKKICDVLIQATKLEEYPLIQKDSSIWERHLISNEERGAKHFTYTTVVSAYGLLSASKISAQIGDIEQSVVYNNASKVLIDGISSHLIDNNTHIIKDSLERTDVLQYVDASVVEAINFGFISPNSEEAQSTMKAFEEHLAMKHRPIGYCRNKQGTWYDSQEWIVVDLRLSRAFNLMGNSEKGSQLLEWVVNQSASNFFLMAELYDMHSANYAGAFPMCGFGPGAYILYHWNL